MFSRNGLVRVTVCECDWGKAVKFMVNDKKFHYINWCKYNCDKRMVDLYFRPPPDMYLCDETISAVKHSLNSHLERNLLQAMEEILRGRYCIFI